MKAQEMARILYASGDATRDNLHCNWCSVDCSSLVADGEAVKIDDSLFGKRLFCSDECCKNWKKGNFREGKK